MTRGRAHTHPLQHGTRIMNIVQCSLLHDDCPLHLLYWLPTSLRASILRSSLPASDRWSPPGTRHQRQGLDTHRNGCRSRDPSKLSLPLAGLADIERDEIVYECSAEYGVRSEALQNIGLATSTRARVRNSGSHGRTRAVNPTPVNTLTSPLGFELLIHTPPLSTKSKTPTPANVFATKCNSHDVRVTYALVVAFEEEEVRGRPRK